MCKNNMDPILLIRSDFDQGTEIYNRSDIFGGRLTALTVRALELGSPRII